MLPNLRRDLVFGDIDRPFDVLRQHFDGMMRGTEGGIAAYPVDIHEDENHFTVDAEMPGFTKDDVNVTLENGVLTIEAERSETSDDKGELHLKERRFNRIRRVFKLPTAVDEGKVDAKLEDGVLKLVLHKREEVKPRKIAIK